MENELITQLRYAESRSAMLTAIVESSDDAIISKDLRGIVTSWNLSAERIFGYAAEEMIGQSILTLIPEALWYQEPHILNRLAKGERIEHLKTHRVTKAGKIIQVSLTISPVKDRNGGIIGVSKIARDISDHSLAAEKEAILAAIIESSNDAIISKNLESIITSWNRSAERIFGYRAEEMIGKSILNLVPANRQQEEPLILARLKNGEAVEHFETQRITKTGQLIDVSLTISALKDNLGHITGLSQIARDITERKKEDQRKNDFISIVSHELKTPLTTMRSYIQLALTKDAVREDKPTENLLVRAEAQTTKMSVMIHDFLNLSRLEDGKMSLNCSVFPLEKLVEEVTEEVRILSPAHHIILEMSCDTDIDADRDKIYQVLTNLLANAIKYSDKGTIIRVSCQKEHEQVTIEVHDQGIGIAEEDQPRLFERFYRVREEQNKHIGGFGIGLYLVSELLRLHGSTIKVKSKPGEGSVFSFSLPVCSSLMNGL